MKKRTRKQDIEYAVRQLERDLRHAKASLEKARFYVESAESVLMGYRKLIEGKGDENQKADRWSTLWREKMKKEGAEESEKSSNS